MANQRTTSRNLTLVVRAVVLALAVIIFFGRLDGPAAQFLNLIAATVREVLVLLPSFILTASQSLGPDASYNHHCAFETLIVWPLVQSVLTLA
jgi:hypothetical protein